MAIVKKTIMKFEPKDQLFGYNPDTQILVWMKPSEFLDKTPKLESGHWESPPILSLLTNLAHKMENGIPLDPLFLDIDTVNCKVTNHEGRHRAMAAEKAGIARVPVIVYLMDNHRNRISTKEYLKNGCKCNYFEAHKQE